MKYRYVPLKPYKGANVSKTERAAIYERDGWTCQLCGRAVDPNATGPKRATLDHRVPASRGGKNTPQNLQLAHARCNERKSGR